MTFGRTDLGCRWSPSITNARMRQLECSLEDFMDIFKPENVEERDTKDGLNYIAGQLLDYTLPRGKGNVIDRCAVVLDCDDADTKGVEALCEALMNHLNMVQWDESCAQAERAMYMPASMKT